VESSPCYFTVQAQAFTTVDQ